MAYDVVRLLMGLIADNIIADFNKKSAPYRGAFIYSTVTLLAKFLGLSTSQPLATAI